jgi:acetamidase/formamidase
VLKNIRVPIRPHFGTMGLAPKEADYVNSIPPSYTGGNIDNWRIGKGATMYYPVAVDGALLSVGDPHASQGDSELCGTAIECSLTGTFQIILHKKADLGGTALEALDFPMIETADEWVMSGFSYPNYLVDLGANAQSDIFAKSSIDLAMRDAFRKMRGFLMNTKALTEDEAISLMSVAVDFGITQVVDGNWGVHAIIKKNVFAGT